LRKQGTEKKKSSWLILQHRRKLSSTSKCVGEKEKDSSKKNRKKPIGTRGGAGTDPSSRWAARGICGRILRGRTDEREDREGESTKPKLSQRGEKHRNSEKGR